jgi:pimeloyl-ACP methyl ester carboxylesterase
VYCSVECLRAEGDRSPVVFLHGFPDSPEMYREYHTESEREQPWLRGRPIYTVAFPNRFTNPHYPPLAALTADVLQQEVDAILAERIATSPTGRIVLVAHDWGATCSWSFIRRHGGAGIESMVSLSVASSFRFDVWEHGPRALGWVYSLLFGSPYYVPIPAYRRFVAGIIVRYGGYRSPQWETIHRDTFYYWYGPLRPLQLPFDLIGLRARPGFTDFDFPVLYIRSKYDRIASTSRFERAVARRQDCRLVVWPDVNHWFPEQHAERVLAEIRTFVAD